MNQTNYNFAGQQTCTVVQHLTHLLKVKGSSLHVAAVRGKMTRKKSSGKISKLIKNKLIFDKKWKSMISVFCVI